MKYSGNKFAYLIVFAPTLLLGLFAALPSMAWWPGVSVGTAVVLFLSGIFLSFLFHLYLRHNLHLTEHVVQSLYEERGKDQINALLADIDNDEEGGLKTVLRSAIQREQKHVHQLEASEGKLNALFEVVKEGIVIADEAGIIRDVNPSLCEMLGYTPNELCGTSINRLMPHPYAAHHDQYMHNAIESNNMGFMGMYRDLQALRKDGTTLPVEINVDILRLSEGNLFAATMRNISAQKEYERQLMNAKLKAEIANEAKSKFLSMMSHEIRTPLNGVMGTLELLQSEVKELEKRELISVASRSATNLLHIVDDILDMSKAESGIMELEQLNFELFRLLEESLELYYSKARDKGISLVFDLPHDLPVQLLGDSYRLRQMVNNLLSNAIKFTHQGQVSMTARWQEADEETVEVNIEIADTGIGIPAEKLDNIFEPFVQVDSSISREYGGTGLGLTIVKRLSELMGGELLLESEYGRGSRFILRLPFRRSAERVNESGAWLQGHEVVCIDVQDRFPLRYMRHYGANVRELTEEQFAREVAEQGLRGDLFVFGKSDESALRMLNQQASQAQTGQAFILIRESSASWAMQLDERVIILRQPILKMSLDSIFQSLYDLQQTPKKEQSVAGETMKKILLVEDNPVNQMVAKAMLEKMGYEVSVAVNGQEGVDAIRQQPYDLVLMDLHMPVMDGYEATRHIRGLPHGELPILAMTADASMADKENCLSVGMDDHLPKPIKMDELERVLQQWLRDSD